MEGIWKVVVFYLQRIVATLVLGTYQAYAYDENFKGYEVHNISVKADAAKDEYGNTVRNNPIIVRVVT